MVAGEERVFVKRPLIKIRAAFPADMPFITEHIGKFRLDNEDMDYQQFVVSVEGDKVIGFGRIRPHREIVELGSVGVIEGRRDEGIGTMIVKHLVDIFPANEVYITTEIPGYFERLGFTRVEPGPGELIEKLRGVCRSKGRNDAVIMISEKGARFGGNRSS